MDLDSDRFDPTTGRNEWVEEYTRRRRRDEFTKAALIGLLSGRGEHELPGAVEWHRWAVSIADRTIAELDRPKAELPANADELMGRLTGK